LNPNGSKDFELKIKDLLNIEVGDYRMTNLDSNPIAVNDSSAIKVEGQEQKEDKADITTSSEDDSKGQFDDDSDLDFDDSVNGDEVEGDYNMD
jgi:hypothetical protein